MLSRLTHGLLLLLLLLLLVACNGAPEPSQPVEVPPPSVEPELVLTPPPGGYTLFRLTVTATTEPDHDLFFDLDQPPELSTHEAYRGSFDVRLVKSSTLFVVVRSPDGETFGPYEFQYGLTSLAGDGACQLTEPARQFYREDEAVPLLLQYLLPAALARLEVSVNGVWQEIEVAHHQGSRTVELGPFAEGDYEVGCRVVLLNEEWDGNGVGFVVDGTPPSGAWLTSGASFTQADWRNVFLVTAEDSLSGLASVQLCNAQSDVCIPMREDEADIYGYPTALTDQTALSSDLYVRLRDVAGNESIVSTEHFDFTSFQDPVPARAPLPITLTTDSDLWQSGALLQGPDGLVDVRLDFSVVAGGDLTELLRFSGLPVPVGEWNAVPLAPGWNEFLYRVSDSGYWRSFGIYHVGVEVNLPPSEGQWLVFSSRAGWPTMQSQLEEVVTPSDSASYTRWTRPWFDVPNLFFVEDDLDGEQRWMSMADLWVDPVDPVSSWTENRRAWAEPVGIEPVLHEPDPEPRSYAKQVSIDVAADVPPGDIFFRWFISPRGFPTYHEKLFDADEFPVGVTVPERNGLCMFFVDVYGNGLPTADEPRAWGPCLDEEGEGRDFLIDWRHDDELTISQSTGLISGLHYAGAVTGTITVTTEDGQPLISYPSPTWQDRSGVGQASFQDGFNIRYPALPAVLDVYHAGEAAQLTFDAQDGILTETISVAVTDEVGQPLQSLVLTSSTSGVDDDGYAATDPFGLADVPVLGPVPYTVYASRDGWLSEKAVTESTEGELPLRLLSPGVTGGLYGTVTAEGEPVGNAEVTWESELYVARGRTADDGTYAIPASGGTGVLTLSIHQAAQTRTETFAAEVTLESILLDLDITREAMLSWPIGLGSAPQVVLGPLAAPQPVHLRVGQGFYTAAITDAADDIWMGEWSDGFRRFFAMPGALPPFLAVALDSYPLPSSPSFDRIYSYARCGDWEREVRSSISAQSDCWRWLGDDSLQTYALGSLLDEAYPQHMGLGLLDGRVRDSSGTLIEDARLLVLRDQILTGRTIHVMSEAGFISAAVPYGIYQVRDGAGNLLHSNVRVVPGENNDYSFTLP